MPIEVPDLINLLAIVLRNKLRALHIHEEFFEAELHCTPQALTPAISITPVARRDFAIFGTAFDQVFKSVL